MIKASRQKKCKHPFPIYQGTNKITGEKSYLCGRCGRHWSK